MRRTFTLFPILVLAALALAGCGNQGGGSGGAFGGPTRTPAQYTDPAANPNNIDTEDTVWTLFNRSSNENVVLVNRYIWSATLEVLDFLPVQSVDPFTGVIVTGYGVPPGGGRAYRATVLIDDPALDARSLNVALQTQGGGTANPATVRAIEDAILTRARQLRVADNRL
jgi:hypothetical protein